MGLVCVGYSQVGLIDNVRLHEIGPVVVEDRYRVTPIYRLDPDRNLHLASLQAVFEQVPGVFWMGTSVHEGRPVLRGLSYQRILLLYNHLLETGITGERTTVTRLLCVTFFCALRFF